MNDKNIYTQSGSTSLQKVLEHLKQQTKKLHHTLKMNRMLLSVDVDTNTESIQIIKQICAVKFWGQHIIQKERLVSISAEPQLQLFN